MGVGAKVKGYIKNKTTGEVKRFLYNPSDFSDSRSVNFSEILAPGSSYPKFQYVSTGARTFELVLYLSNTNKGTVQEHLTFLEQFLPRGSRFSKPPILIFAMGTDVRECLLQTLDRSFTDFDSNLNKKEATVTLSLVEI